MSEISAVVH